MRLVQPTGKVVDVQVRQFCRLTSLHVVKTKIAFATSLKRPLCATAAAGALGVRATDETRAALKRAKSATNLYILRRIREGQS